VRAFAPADAALDCGRHFGSIGVQAVADATAM